MDYLRFMMHHTVIAQSLGLELFSKKRQVIVSKFDFPES